VQKYEAVAGQSVIKQVATETIKSEGIAGLYRGFGISLFGSMPAAGLYFGSYEFFKKSTLEFEYLQ
jgi:solute carrier family 25 (adenine nucleotide translocator) protein 4/5/6/31